QVVEDAAENLPPQVKLTLQIGEGRRRGERQGAEDEEGEAVKGGGLLGQDERFDVVQEEVAGGEGVGGEGRELPPPPGQHPAARKNQWRGRPHDALPSRSVNAPGCRPRPWT